MRLYGASGICPVSSIVQDRAALHNRLSLQLQRFKPTVRKFPGVLAFTGIKIVCSACPHDVVKGVEQCIPHPHPRRGRCQLRFQHHRRHTPPAVSTTATTTAACPEWRRSRRVWYRWCLGTAFLIRRQPPVRVKVGLVSFYARFSVLIMNTISRVKQPTRISPANWPVADIPVYVNPACVSDRIPIQPPSDSRVEVPVTA